MSINLEALRSLTKERSRAANRESLSADEGREIILAARRGVRQQDIAEAIGLKHRNNLPAILGTWALHHAKVD